MKHYLILTVALIGFCGVFVNAQARTEADFIKALRDYDAAPDGPDKERLAAAVDAAAAQKDAVYSRLYWQTDLAEALAESKATHRPVLSLRLLGRLDEELSCANSRFFRTTLYANEKVADLLRNHFVLHWESVRPAPKLTVDFGDGRTITTTVTGNSIHYVLDEQGRIADALPGLCSPGRFISLLQDAERAYRNTPADWMARLKSIASKEVTLIPNPTPPAQTTANPATPPRPPTAGRAAIRAVSKLRIESTAVTTVTGEPIKIDSEKLLAGHVQFDARSLELMRRKMPPGLSTSDVDRMLTNLRRSIARDESINLNDFRPKICRHVMTAPAESLNQVNAWVYANVFATPGSDPWLGLLTVDAFNGVENGGVAIPQSTASR